LKFKVDENLPTEYASILRGAGFEADTVSDEKLSGSHPGIVVFRPESQDKPTLVALLKRLVPVLLQLSPKHQLWIVEPDRIRYREE